MEKGTLLEHFQGEKFTIIEVAQDFFTGQEMYVLQSNQAFHIVTISEEDVFDKILGIDRIVPRFKVVFY